MSAIHVDGPVCKNSCNDQADSNECPRYCKKCSSSVVSSQEGKIIDDRKPKYSCDDGWSQITGNEITDWGAMKSMTGKIDFSNLNGKSMYIYGYNYDAKAYVYFESQQDPKNISFYMDLNPNSEIRLSKKRAGQWSNYAVFPITLSCCSSKFYPRVHYFWMIEVKFGMNGDRQFIDIINSVNDETVYRFYPDDPVKPYDRYYFTQRGHNVLGVAWSNPGYMAFKSGLPINSEIQLIGKMLTGHVTITLTRNNGDMGAIIIFRRAERTTTETEVTMKGILAKDNCGNKCQYADMYDNKLTVITIRRKSGGFEVWHKGYLFLTLNNADIKREDIEKIQVLTGFYTYGMSVLDCQS
ncbi:hypothetical protein AB6A40_004386 [Gnathostoma spinigerum]|uniref:Uncharacterized protein n=1 Tax=Gnathostoma spinigerum TaxID=75299 RepID=A0ABD6EM81_9BILA